MSVEIPISNDPGQSFEINLPKPDGNITLGFYVNWNEIAEYWQCNISNPLTGTDYITALPLLTGQGYYQNLLAQWAYLEIGQLFIIPQMTATSESPGLNDWGSNFRLVWGP